MSISFINDTVTVIRAAAVTERGDSIEDWGSATEHAVPNCRVQPLVGEEVLGLRDAVVSRWRLFGPSTMDVLETDRVRHAGTVYEIDGAVQRWPSPTGALAHTELALKRVGG